MGPSVRLCTIAAHLHHTIDNLMRLSRLETAFRRRDDVRYSCNIFLCVQEKTENVAVNVRAEPWLPNPVNSY